MPACQFPGLPQILIGSDTDLRQVVGKWSCLRPFGPFGTKSPQNFRIHSAITTHKDLKYHGFLYKMIRDSLASSLLMYTDSPSPMRCF